MKHEKTCKDGGGKKCHMMEKNAGRWKKGSWRSRRYERRKSQGKKNELIREHVNYLERVHNSHGARITSFLGTSTRSEVVVLIRSKVDLQHIIDMSPDFFVKHEFLIWVVIGVSLWKENVSDEATQIFFFGKEMRKKNAWQAHVAEQTKQKKCTSLSKLEKSWGIEVSEK